MKKKLLSLGLALTLALSLTACGGEKAADSKSISVAASTTPHAEILEVCKPILAEKGYELQIHEYSDYVIPNTAVEDGEETANFFQHKPYLDDFNKERGTHIVSVGGVHIEPMGIYAGKTASLEELSDGAVISIPNDATNEGRALLLLEKLGNITLKEDAGLTATPKDIAENPKNLEFKELEAVNLPASLSDVDFSIINSNYALGAELNPVEDSLAIEDADSPYANIVAVKEGNENNEAVVALMDVLHSDTVRDFINEKYAGAVVPAF